MTRRGEDVWIDSALDRASGPASTTRERAAADASRTLFAVAVDWQAARVLMQLAAVTAELSAQAALDLSAILYEAQDRMRLGHAVRQLVIGASERDAVAIYWEPGDPHELVVSMPRRKGAHLFPTADEAVQMSEDLYRAAADLQNGGGQDPKELS